MGIFFLCVMERVGQIYLVIDIVWVSKENGVEYNQLRDISR